MSIVYLNGNYIPRAQATIDIEDRGFMFADGVYEVLHFYFGHCLAMQAHTDRMLRSLDMIGIDAGDEVRKLPQVSEELVKRNDQPHGKVYWQVTRGSAVREHSPPPNMTPTVLAICYPGEVVDFEAEPASVNAITIDDIRWHKCVIKSVMLLPNALGRQMATAAGAYEAIQVRDGIVTEGCSTNAFAVRDGAVWTHPADEMILGGITRDILLHLARENGIDVCEQRFDVDTLRGADEVFLTGTSTHIASVTQLDKQPVGDGNVGPIAKRLNGLLMNHIRSACVQAK